MSFVSHKAGTSRYFDCIYDTSFFVGGRKDGWRAATQAMNCSTPIQALSKYNLMFSTLPKSERQIYYKENTIFRHYRARAGDDFKRPENRVDDIVDIRGKDRANFYFYQPHVPTVLSLNLPLENNDNCYDPNAAKYRDVGCQSIYRESSAQTHPYLPDVYLDSPKDPNDYEVYIAAKLLKGCEEPNNIEVQIVERGRKRRAWERCILPKDVTQGDRYRAAIEAFEWEEWLAREQEIHSLQHVRYELVQKLMKERDERFKENSFQKLEQCCKKISVDRGKEMKRLEREYNRDMRKLNYKFSGQNMKYKKDDVAVEYIDRSSDLYGPQIRFGINPKRRHFVAYMTQFENRLEKLTIKNETIQSLECPFAKLTALAKPKPLATEYVHGFLSDKSLRQLYESLKYFRSESTRVRGTPLCFLPKVSSRINVSASSTIIGAEFDVLGEFEYQSYVMLQKVVKGRSIQNILYNGKREFKGLIDELGSTYTINAVRKMFPQKTLRIKNSNKIGLCMRKRMERILKNQREVNTVMQDFEGVALGWILEFLEKELDRLYEQKKVQAICMLAEEERYKREAAEAGRRQVENKRRAEAQSTFNEFTKVGRDTIAMFLLDAVQEETERKSTRDAQIEIDQAAKEIDLAVHRCLKERRKMSPEDASKEDKLLITEIVNDYVFPQVQTAFWQRENERNQRSHLLAAHKILYESNLMEDVLWRPSSSGAQITSDVLNNLLETVVSSEEKLQVKPCDHPMQRVIDSYINKILKVVIPPKKFKTQPERIADITISQILRCMLPSETDKCERLHGILGDLNTRLGDIVVTESCSGIPQSVKDKMQENVTTINATYDDICVRPESIPSGSYERIPTPPEYDNVSINICPANDYLEEVQQVFKNEYFD